VTFRRAIDAPTHYQWDDDSRLPSPDPGSAPNNCGPTSVENVAHAYTGRRFGVYRTRLLAVGDPSRATSVGEQRDMLIRRGVDCVFAQVTLAGIKQRLTDGRMPVILGLDMSKVPLEVAGHPFRGMHAVVALQNAAGGMLIRDPNFSRRTNRTDPTDGKRYYPDWVIQNAYVNIRGWAITPLHKMPDVSWRGRVRANVGAIIRFHPIQQADEVFAEARRNGYTYRPGGERLWPNTYTYEWNGEVYEKAGVKWYRVRTQAHNDIRFIRVGNATIVRKA